MRILFDDMFYECVYRGVLAQLWKGQLRQHSEAHSQHAEHSARYEGEIARRKDNLAEDTHIKS